MSSLLRSISLTDFRSIRGTISVPLDASIVLIHGQNGAGKTSLLSGIELALTGAVPSLHRLDDEYFSHLVHKDAASASITVTVNASSGELSKKLEIQGAAVRGEPLFKASDSAFFSERCYLAQSTMNRLLELYQGKESKKGDSALTKFVKDLLGLDHLDGLISGLDDAGHVARLKNSLNAYKTAVDQVPMLESRLASMRAESAVFRERTGQLQASLDERAKFLAVPLESMRSVPFLQEVGSSTKDEVELQRIAQLRREIVAARTQWESLRVLLSGSAIADAERSSSQSSQSLDRWREDGGRQISQAIDRVRLLLPDTPDPAVVGPSRAINYAIEFVEKELYRNTELLKGDVDVTTQIANLDEQLQRAASRLQVLDEQISGHLANADQLAQALTSLLPLIADQECPVCGRDFSEVSTEHLQSHLSVKISTLVESAGRLQGFVRERSEALKIQTDGLRKRDVLLSSQLNSDERTRVSLLRVELDELARTLRALVLSANEGEQLLGTATRMSRLLSELRSQSEQATGFRSRLGSFEVALGASTSDASDETETILARFEALVEQRQKQHVQSQEARTLLLADLNTLIKTSGQHAELDKEIANSDLKLIKLQQELAGFNQKMMQARDLAKVAKSVRTEIVRSVFSDSLNALWKELFIRLAPNEFFVPAFALPEKEDGVVEAVLETHYRDGGRGGNPRAMLSAGNLNTAALTLFLALHLSVNTRFPCLIIDDPVQSMDEVHIAQLAALLRTLSRQHNRQIIIAVHEKPLFDYLALELTPASEGERLITIELGTSSEGQTFERHQVIGYLPDRTFAAA
jgi:exonuclease SbcC